ncbi:hypothetical protein SERLA73DRAFT_175438 [Serpula lacrymans var. lacrymans S7.3]|uniref:Tim44-like domain-containing protein n=2 Tax=Serpula lacrymans var. lacrymans TaxID=341189 RepID=F8PJX1_SERL3|nr:uncharacterized protein SERLADRAFT_457702 [Serpula lacrymans var. lacrymans S7.9]EGO03793.1 hypothetical protein SERLA73DRAFT_175438 [Serpula lacrymans var. lacrymans S7.3]EGO29655.1 hypothetical protein SERLADRAFT_457702 [Serpula lacrymans var. lacrymans S7.9]
MIVGRAQLPFTARSRCFDLATPLLSGTSRTITSARIHRYYCTPVHRSSSRHSPYIITSSPGFSRAYAQKTKSSPSTTRHTAPRPPAPSSTLKTSTTSKPSATASATSSATSSTPINTATPNPSPPSAKAKSPSLVRSLLGKKSGDGASKTGLKAKSTDAQIAELENMMKMPRHFPTTDMWGQKMLTLDVQVPRDLRAVISLRPISVSTIFDAIKDNTGNWMKNVFSMFTIAKANAFPDITVKSPWSRQLFKVGSYMKDAWVSPLIRTASIAYVGMNNAVAEKSIQGIKNTTSDNMQAKLLKLVRSRDPGLIYHWRCISEASPTRIVSIRAAEGYLAQEPPKQGNRLVIHALVRFDSFQTLQVFTKKGVPVDGKEPMRRHVTEYMVFEKRGWYDTPWTVREQLYEKVEKV